MWIKLLTLCAFWAGFSARALGGAEVLSTQELIRGVMARSGAVFSGRMKYQEQPSFWGKPLKEPEEHRVVFSGSSWRLYSQIDATKLPPPQIPPEFKKKYGDMPINELTGTLEITNVTHGGKSIKYSVTPRSDGSVAKSANITQEKPLSSLGQTFNAPPTFAGSFWYECTKRFIQSRKEKAIRKPEVEVNGVKTQVLEWPVSEVEKFDAFHAVISAKRGGALRLYIAPQLGFALPRIENVGTDGRNDTVFDASEFIERVPGIFVPNRCSIQQYIDGKPSFRLDYEILELADTNGNIPDSEFVVRLPAGTNVVDGRSGTSGTLIEITQGGPIPEGLEDIIAVQPPPSFWGRNSHTALIVGIVVGIALLVAAYFGRRFLLRRRKA